MKDYEGRKVDFDKMNNARKRKLYSEMWRDLVDFKIEQKDDSVNSYRFSGNEDKDQILITQFKIGKEDQKQFKDKYDMAVTGDGQEENRITTLHSSSLCALLHFYNVEKHALTLEFKTKNNKNGEIKRRVRFTKSVFEFKSPVIDNPSNMDVVLIGKDETSNKDVVLFLESKFAEYYLSAGTTCRGISRNYLNNKYTQALYKNNIGALELIIKDSKKDSAKFDLVTKDPNEPFYIAGIKQMISHYCGVRNLLDMKEDARDKYPYFEGNNSEKDKKISEILEKIQKEAIVILGEIVFDYKIGKLEIPLKGKEGKQCFKVYSDRYDTLARQIAQIEDSPKNFEIVTELLKYSTIKNNMADKVKAFYYGK